MIEYTIPVRGRPDRYCWICGGYGCENPQETVGVASSWSPERVSLPLRIGDEPLAWLNRRPAPWWGTQGRAA